MLGAELQGRRLRVAYATLTGKAAGVLKRSLEASGVRAEYIGTIHRLMYTPLTDEGGAVTGWEKSAVLDFDLIVIDEASMVSTDILVDLQSYRVPILAVGDHGQLSPVGEDAGLMKNPDIRLETVRRQALDNPVVALSVLIRTGGDWRKFVKTCSDPRLQYLSGFGVSDRVRELFSGDALQRSIADDPMIICGLNKTRQNLNAVARIALKTDRVLVENERVICLKNQYLSSSLLANGFRGKVESVSDSPNPHQIMANVSFQEEELRLVGGRLCKPQFGTEKTFKAFTEVSSMYKAWDDCGILMDYGYAITCHKAQASQASNVLLIVERFGNPDDFVRWAYTGVTRSSESLIVCF